MNPRGTEIHYSQRGRAERLIAAGRLVLAAFSLLAIWLDPSDPARYSRIVYSLVSGYLGYALVMALVIWRLEGPPRHLHLISHILDLFVFAVIMFFSSGPVSPFFAFFVFSLVCGTLRWQWKGVLWTTVAALAAVTFMALYPTVLLHDPKFELNFFIIRLGYLTVAATLLGYLGAYEQKLLNDLSRLAAWPSAVSGGIRGLIRQILEQSARILGAPRVLLAWEEEGEPWLHLASLAGGEFQYTREPPAVFGGVVAEPLTCTSFFCPDTRCLSPKVIPKSPAGLQGWTGAPLHPGLQTRFAVNSVLSLTLNGGNLKGYLLAPDKPRMTSDDLVLGEIVANKAAARLDRFYLLRQLQQAADAEERIRLARDLHDGLLQSLTAAALQLETVNRLMEENTQEAARQRLMEIQQLIAAEQKDLRFHIRQLKPSSANLPDGDSSLEARLGELAGRIERHWGLRVQMNIKHLGQKIPRALEQEIYFLVHESLINAARHAQAPTVRAELGVEDNRVYIHVADDGRGFPFRGRYDHVTLAKMNLGPATLKERIAALGGSLAIESSDSGACLEISIPLRGIGDEDAHSPHIG